MKFKILDWEVQIRSFTKVSFIYRRKISDRIESCLVFDATHQAPKVGNSAPYYYAEVFRCLNFHFSYNPLSFIGKHANWLQNYSKLVHFFFFWIPVKITLPIFICWYSSTLFTSTIISWQSKKLFAAYSIICSITDFISLWSLRGHRLLGHSYIQPEPQPVVPSNFHVRLHFCNQRFLLLVFRQRMYGYLDYPVPKSKLRLRTSLRSPSRFKISRTFVAKSMVDTDGRLTG